LRGQGDLLTSLVLFRADDERAAVDSERGQCRGDLLLRLVAGTDLPFEIEPVVLTERPIVDRFLYVLGGLRRPSRKRGPKVQRERLRRAVI
jgi:hypothetical protein